MDEATKHLTELHAVYAEKLAALYSAAEAANKARASFETAHAEAYAAYAELKDTALKLPEETAIDVDAEGAGTGVSDRGWPVIDGEEVFFPVEFTPFHVNRPNYP